MVNGRRWLVTVLTLYFLLGVGYSLLMPIWEAPDEPAHYHLAWRIVRRGEYASPKINYEAHQPRAYYYLGSLVIRGLDKVNPALSNYYLPKEYKANIRVPVRRFDWTADNYRFLLGVYALRWINIVLGGIALWLNWRTFRLIAPGKVSLCLGALAVAALTPQYVHIVSSVNNDALGILAGALLFYLIIQVLQNSSKLLGLISISLAIVLPFITKLTVLPFSAAVLVTTGWTWFAGRAQKRWLVYTGLLVLLGAGISYVFFPETVRLAKNEISWRIMSFQKNAFTAKYLRFIASQIVWTYWGKVGWLAVGLPIRVVHLLTALGFLGMALQLRNLIRSKTDLPNFKAWIAVWLVALFTMLAVIRNGLTTPATQGRLLFPAIGALSFLIVAGWHETLSPRVQRFLPALIVWLFLVCNLVLWMTGILPVYFQPFLD